MESFAEMHEEILRLCRKKGVAETIYSFSGEEPEEDDEYLSMVHSAPADEVDIRALEEQHGFTLPEDFFYFLTKIGNGSEAPYPLGIRPFPQENEIRLPKLGTAHTAQLKEGPPVYTLDDGDLHNMPGILLLGGDGGMEARLVVTGEYRGRVLLTSEGHCPYLAPQKNFLEWYLGALHESVAGYDMLTFGWHLYGSPRELVQRYYDAKSDAERGHAVDSMAKFRNLTAEEQALIEPIYRQQTDEERRRALCWLLMRTGFGPVRNDVCAYLRSEHATLFLNSIHRSPHVDCDEWRDAVLAALPYMPKRDRSMVFQQLLLKFDGFGGEEYLQLLRDSGPEIACEALDYFESYLPLDRAADFLLPLLEQENGEVAATAARVLARTDDDRLYAPYVALILDHYPRGELSSTSLLVSIKLYLDRRGDRLERILEEYRLPTDTPMMERIRNNARVTRY